jgi:hypothetical protein
MFTRTMTLILCLGSFAKAEFARIPATQCRRSGDFRCSRTSEMAN